MDKALADLLAVAEDIKRLLILALFRSGVPQGDIGKALGISQGTVSKLFPGGIRAKQTKTK